MGTLANHLNQQSGAGRQSARTRRLGRSGAACLALATLGASLGLLSLLPRTPAFVWNFTESIPTGLYRIWDTEPVKGDIVALDPAGVTGDMLAAHGVLPVGKVLLKRLSAAQGDCVCRSGASITINGAEAARARLTTRDGHPLPAWSGCHVLSADEIFVLAPHPLSFDGRYFGPIDEGQIVGVATPLLTFPLAGAS